MMIRILLIGKKGQLGWELQRTLSTLGQVRAFGYPEIDLVSSESLQTLIRKEKPHLIVNAAAYTNVDKAESEADVALKVNATAPEILAEEMQRLNGALIHYSTDYVYDGKKGSAYVEEDTTNPLNVYGKSKLDGDFRVQNKIDAFMILRTSWVFSTRQGGFVNKVLQWARQQSTLRIVDDQIGNPTSARLLAEITAQVIAQGKGDPIGYIQENSGLYHLAGKGSPSRYEWAKVIIDLDPHKEEQIVKKILPAKTRDFPAPAERPLFSGLDCQKFSDTFSLNIPDWAKSLELAMD